MPSKSEEVIARALQERRRFHRVRVHVAGRLFVPETAEEAVCTVEDISPGDATISCNLKEEPKGRAVLYLDSFGRLEGPIVRRTSGGFVLLFNCSVQKRDRLADQLTLELNRHLLAEADLRRHDRTEAAAGSYAHFTRSSGEQVRCEVLDLSLTGVSVKAEMRPPVGGHILIGHRAGRIARHHADGIGIEFLGVSAPNATLLDRPVTSAPQAASSLNVLGLAPKPASNNAAFVARR